MPNQGTNQNERQRLQKHPTQLALDWRVRTAFFNNLRSSNYFRKDSVISSLPPVRNARRWAAGKT